MKNRTKGNVQIEYIVVMFFCALGIYFGLVGGDDHNPSEIKPLVIAVHDRQNDFIDAVLQP